MSVTDNWFAGSMVPGSISGMNSHQGRVLYLSHEQAYFSKS